MGNALAARVDAGHEPPDVPLRQAIRAALQAWLAQPPALGEQQAMVAEHVRWALAQAQADQ